MNKKFGVITTIVVVLTVSIFYSFKKIQNVEYKYRINWVVKYFPDYRIYHSKDYNDFIVIKNDYVKLISFREADTGVIHISDTNFQLIKPITVN